MAKDGVDILHYVSAAVEDTAPFGMVPLRLPEGSNVVLSFKSNNASSNPNTRGIA